MSGVSKINPDTKQPFAEWPDALYRLLRSFDIKQVALVPDAGHSRLIRLAEEDKDVKVVRLATEEEGIALLTGAWLGGERGVLLMQSSGVGNCINMMSLAMVCHIPLVILVTMRGDWGEFNSWQVPMGQATQSVLEAVGVLVSRADDPADIESAVSGAARIAFNASRPVAVLIGQKILGAKDFKELAKP